MILLLSIVFVGCTLQNNEQKAKKETSNKEKILTLPWPRDIGEMNPHVYNPSQLIAQAMIYEPLVSYKEGGKLEPALAESWTISEDGKEYTFKLRQNVKFSDGTDFNAKIVKKNIDAIMKNVKMHNWLGLINMIDKTEVVNDSTFKIILKQAYYPTLQELAVVRPVRFLGESGFPDDGDTSKGVKKPIGTGPWMLEEYKKDNYAVFTRNPNYWGESPKVEKIEIKIIPDAETRVLAFEKGELDLIYGEGSISLDAFKQLEESGKYKTSISESVATRQLVMNTTKEQLSDIKVRLALQYGFNKQAMVEGVTSGLEEKADNILAPNLLYTNIKITPIKYDVEKAKKYLEEAGWKLSSGKSVREKDGKALELELMYDKSNQIQKAMAEALQAEWAMIGVKLNIAGVELPVQVKRFGENDFDLNFYSNYGAPYDPHTFLNIVSVDGFGFSDALSNLPVKQQLDQQIKEVFASMDEKKRKELYSSILHTLQDQAAIVPISYIKKTTVYQKSVTSFEFPANRDDHPFTEIVINN
ncbi:MULTISPECIES: nickel ABC transporter substrate-binding protein [Bacillus cereus group]|uniref:Nickel ABC transporter, nickel/metallophore periplasmic binding protein n=1 Tax=Bacillus cereus TaxID=1396 RepID=A0A9W7QDL4_BACCE|nr:nickel ABC transporter substrate-binding protein [Bacillus cereus]KAB2391114.1 nickel ABC transporter, nickel/metallophore periplasmic binding protein [Bacillus cereus]KAB2407439.1 nickel ABC transporter, nickel/metallophore periplasmic binding protein [Bacillus cereus]KAB2428647.1 nickel ABC transporter, nickel/metallophore periplasmic binding protein [Bacillus cereus]